jgi:hypothetical protein
MEGISVLLNRTTAIIPIPVNITICTIIVRTGCTLIYPSQFLKLPVRARKIKREKEKFNKPTTC